MSKQVSNSAPTYCVKCGGETVSKSGKMVHVIEPAYWHDVVSRADLVSNSVDGAEKNLGGDAGLRRSQIVIAKDNSSDADQPCPDPRCNDHLGAMPIPQYVTAVAWAEKVIELDVIAEAARDFVWEPENWEAYEDSKASNSVAWPPEFLLLAQAVEKKYGAMPLKACMLCDHNDVVNGLCAALVPLIDKEPHGMKQCRCACVFPAQATESSEASSDPKRGLDSPASETKSESSSTPTREAVELLPCPFCGGKAEQCDPINAICRSRCSYSTARIKDWNTRAVVATAQQWMPIETAPKSGAEILTTNWRGSGKAYYVDLSRWLKLGEREIWVGRNRLPTYPTHWMPLPAPPQDTASLKPECRWCAAPEA